jgi:hypothetical protein
MLRNGEPKVWERILALLASFGALLLAIACLARDPRSDCSQFTAPGKKDEIVVAVPLFDHVQAFMDLAAQVNCLIWQ